MNLSNREFSGSHTKYGVADGARTHDNRNHNLSYKFM